MWSGGGGEDKAVRPGAADNHLGSFLQTSQDLFEGTGEDTRHGTDTPRAGTWVAGVGIPATSSKHTPDAKMADQLLEHHERQVHGVADKLCLNRFKNQHLLDLPETLQNVFTLPGSFPT